MSANYVCSCSGTGGMAEGCPRGCSGARVHYSNDGHRDCEEWTHE